MSNRLDTLMLQEAGEAASCVERLFRNNRSTVERIAMRFRAAPPAVVITCARGSSDNAATYGKYLFETKLGIPTSSMGLSVASIFDASVRMSEALCVAISQSGQSPDLLAAVRTCKRGGAFVIALTNDLSSPLATLADEVIDLCAAPERSVAATKSFIASLAGLACLVAACAERSRGMPGLVDSLNNLPQALTAAFKTELGPSLASLVKCENMYVLGRGYGLGIAQEAALKLKETCAIHAEAFSAAEVRHGPMQIVGPGFPVLGFVTSDEAGRGVTDACAEFAKRGATSIVTTAGMFVGDPCLEPIVMIQGFYVEANRLALARNLDPDKPQHLRKLTLTM